MRFVFAALLLGVEQVVDEQLRRDRVGRAGERRDRVGALDAALLRDVVGEVRDRLLDREPVGAPDVADPDVARRHRRDRVGRVGADERLLLLRAARAPRRARRCLSVLAEWPSWISVSPKTSCQSSSIEMCPFQRWSHSAFELVGVVLDPGRVVADAGRPPHVRDRVLVARVVARVRPLRAEVADVRQERLVELRDDAALDHVPARRPRSGS